MIDSNFNNAIIRRRMGVLNGKKFNIKPIGFGEQNYLRKFSTATSLHGVINLGEPKRPCLERIFWIFVISLVFLMCGYQIYQLYNNWMEGHIITILSESNRYLSPSDNVPFPGITICSDLQLQNLETLKTKNKTLNREYEDCINLVCHVYDPNLDVSMNYINPKTWDVLMNNHRIFCDQRVVTISWIRVKIDIPCQYFQPIYTIYGICYSMNMIPFNQLLNKDYNQVLSNLNHSKADIITKANERKWNPEIGFIKTAKPYDLPWKVIGDTVEDSVEMIFSLKKNKSNEHCPQTDTGMTLFLHSPIDVPASMQPTAYIAVNNIAYVTTTFTLRTISESLLNWSPEDRHCYYQNERTLKFFQIYTTNNCDIECRANNSLKMCGCVAFYHPSYSIFNENLINPNFTNSCNCLDVCTEIRYQHGVVYTHKNLNKNVTNSENQNEERSIIVMYYKRQIWSIQRTALIPVNELLGNIGGSLGLFLGASIISVFEIIYFFVVRLYVDRWNSKKGKKIKCPKYK